MNFTFALLLWLDIAIGVLISFWGAGCDWFQGLEACLEMHKFGITWRTLFVRLICHMRNEWIGYSEKQTSHVWIDFFGSTLTCMFTISGISNRQPMGQMQPSNHSWPLISFKIQITYGATRHLSLNCSMTLHSPLGNQIENSFTLQ